MTRRPVLVRVSSITSAMALLALLRPAQGFVSTCPPSRQPSGLSLSANSDNIASCSALGGNLRRIKMEGEDDGFLAQLSVPTFAADGSSPYEVSSSERQTTRLGLEALVPGAFVVRDAMPTEDCEDIIQTCEQLQFGEYSAGKNNHGALQVLVSDEAARRVTDAISRHVDLSILDDLPSSPSANGENDKAEDDDIRYTVTGINKRWRIYRYEPDGDQTFSPHIDAAFAPSGLSDDGTELIWDATPEGEDIRVVSRMTILMYLNDDFSGGSTNFFLPKIDQPNESDELELVAAVKPKAGSILLFPQAIGEEAVEYARLHWPLHEGSPVKAGSNRPKYVIRSDLMVAKTHGLSDDERGSPLFQYDRLVRETFMPRSPAVDDKFASHLAALYNPHMGVENAGPLLYSLVRFTKVRSIVEIGAGYTSLWLLQALKDNDEEMGRIAKLQDRGKCRLLDTPWAISEAVDSYQSRPSSLLCIDNCAHQKETATGAAAVAQNLGLSQYFEFIAGDAYDMQFDAESIDLLWCDFGVGARMRDFAGGAWKSVRPGGFLVCHSTLTNQGTRDWLDDVRARKDESITGIPPSEFTELSLLEPQKRYQNSITILQRRRSEQSGTIYEEPIYSQYA